MTAGGLDGRVAGTSPHNTAVGGWRVWGGGLLIFYSKTSEFFVFIRIVYKHNCTTLKVVVFPSSQPSNLPSIHRSFVFDCHGATADHHMDSGPGDLSQMVDRIKACVE